MGESLQLVVFRLEARSYAVALDRVMRVMPRPEITPFPQAPEIVDGVFVLHGDPVPVMNVRRRFRLPEASARLCDQLLVLRTQRRRVAFIVDEVTGIAIVDQGDWVSPDAIVPGLEYVQGVARLPDGMVLVHDIDAFLSLEEETRLSSALEERAP